MLAYLHTFHNGLKLIYHHSQGVITHCGLMIGAGSINEPPGKAGLAHFIEHMIFKGTGKRNAFHVLNRLEAVGGDLNAYTTKEETCVHASVMNMHFERAAELLFDIVFNPVFPEKEIRIEKDVVLDEISSCYDNPAEQIFDDFECMIFKNKPLGYPILGSRESIEGINRVDLLNFVRENYQPSNVVFSYVGELSFEKVCKIIEKLLPSGKHKKTVGRSSVYARTKGRHEVMERPYAHSHYIFGGRAYSLKSSKRFALFLINNILGGPGLSSRLNLNIREKYGYTYHIESGFHTFTDTGIFHIYFATENKHFEKCLKLVKKEIDRFKYEPLSEARLSSYKYQLKGQIAIAQESRAALMLNNARHILNYGKPLDVNDVLRRIDAVTVDDILEVSDEIFNFSNMSSMMYKQSGT